MSTQHPRPRFGHFVIPLALVATVAWSGMAKSNAASIKPVSPWERIVAHSYDSLQFVSEFHLANGLTILTKEDHAAPVVYFSVAYKVGSRYEISGQTGLSHILEHMMFKGTKDLPPGAIDHLFLSNGGEINAQTGQDSTIYHELIASDRLELAVRIEADRMENSAFDPTQLKHEMTVVRSELEGDANSPSWQLYNEALLPTAFVAHPYHWPVIGWTPDVEAAAKNRSIIYNYYKEHYMPNNAVVIMVGDFKTAQAVALVQKCFGVYGPGNLETHFVTPEPVQHGERRVVLKRDGTTPEVIMAYHAPGLGTPEHYVLDVVDTILSGGRGSRLYQSLVETGIAQSASASNYDTKDPYLFELDATSSKGVTPTVLENALKSEVIKLQTVPVTNEELMRAKKQIAASFVYDNESVSAQASQLAAYETIGSYRYLDTYLTRIDSVTAADIMRTAKDVMTDDNMTVATFKPQPLPPGAAPPPPPVTDNFGAVTGAVSAQQRATLAALDKKYNMSIPAVGQSKPATAVRTTLPNGMVLIVQENHSSHTVAITGSVLAGSAFESANKYGLAGMTAEMLNRGTKSKTALQLALEMENIGADTSVSAGVESANIEGQCLSEDLSLTLGNIADKLQNPSFPVDQLDKLKSETISAIEQERQDTGGTGGAGAQAEIAFAEALYPEGHPYWMPTLDESATAVNATTLSDISQFYSTYYRPDTTVMVVVGDVHVADVQRAVEKYFGSWKAPSAPRPVLIIPNAASPAKAGSVQVISIPDTSQTSLLWGYSSGLRRNSKNFYAAEIMDYILGGDTFGSRLGKVIRDENGLAYSVYSFIDAEHGAGPLEVFIGTNPSNARKALFELKSLVGQMVSGGVSSDEIRQAKEYLTGSYPLRLETNSGIAGQLLIAQDYDLGLDYPQKRADYYNSVTKNDVSAAIKSYLRPNKAVLIIAGANPAP